jgi:saccharopine dehydrogenase-like NADP-dependent oxidoreductase
MDKKIIVLGAGLVGSAIAIDLNKLFSVTSVDRSDEALATVKSQGVDVLSADLSVPGKIGEVVAAFDLVIGAVPGFMGYKMVEEVIKAGKDIVDISFFPEDPFGLDDLAKQHDVCVVTDCGVAPGMGNIILGYHNERMQISFYECLVGGLPVVREWPYEYKAVFSPIDVIEEYVRPARFVVNGQLVTREALSDAELVDLEGVGTLESWNSDGLRSLVQTMEIPNMIEKTLRYPGCVEYLKVLRETGYFSYEPIEVNGTMVRPIDVTAKLLFPKWQLKPGEEDYTIMRIRIEGTEGNNLRKLEYYLLDRFDKKTGTISMARTTGYTCTAVANLVLTGKYKQKGINPPEYVGRDEDNFKFILNYLSERGVHYKIIKD